MYLIYFIKYKENICWRIFVNYLKYKIGSAINERYEHSLQFKRY